MIRTRNDALNAMLEHINYAVDEAPTAERATTHALIAFALCQIADRLPQGTPTSIADAVER